MTTYIHTEKSLNNKIGRVKIKNKTLFNIAQHIKDKRMFMSLFKVSSEQIDFLDKYLCLETGEQIEVPENLGLHSCFEVLDIFHKISPKKPKRITRILVDIEED